MARIENPQQETHEARDFNPSQETHTSFLQRKAKAIGHYAIARWMMKQGYPFRYAYFVCFNRFPK